jgi:predicted nucleic acid-binding protein
MAVACIDTHILIWGIQRNARLGQEEMIPRALALLAQLDKDRTRVVVPSIVIGEFLLGLPVDEHPRCQELINRRFMVVPYDLLASLHFSRIWHQKKDAKVIETIKQGGATRTELGADAMIVATALAAGATSIYGHDKGVGHLADGFIAFEDIAQMVLQTTFLAGQPPTQDG